MPDQAISTVLGFDFGSKWIGTAVGQTITRSANPLTTLASQHGQPDWAGIENLISTWRPQALIVGIPLNMDGSEQAMTLKAREFAKELQQRFTLPIYQVDERLTSVEAKQQLFDQGGSRKLSKDKINSYAAKLILEGWLNS